MKEKAICSTQGNPDRGSQTSTSLKSAHSATTGHHEDEMGILDTSNPQNVLGIMTWHSHGENWPHTAQKPKFPRSYESLGQDHSSQKSPERNEWVKTTILLGTNTQLALTHLIARFKGKRQLQSASESEKSRLLFVMWIVLFDYI